MSIATPMNKVSAKDVSEYFAGPQFLNTIKKQLLRLGCGILKKSFFPKLLLIKIIIYWSLVVEQEELVLVFGNWGIEIFWQVISQNLWLKGQNA